jgi:hypothetical protein
MRAWSKPSVLAIILAVDGLLSCVFGMVSYFSATSTYATIIDLSGMHEDSLMAAVLGSLSVFYVVIGALCLLAAFMRPPHDVRVAAVMVAMHVWIGARGLHDASREWIIGNPWHDLIIHSLFVVGYVIAIALRRRQVSPNTSLERTREG